MKPTPEQAVEVLREYVSKKRAGLSPAKQQLLDLLAGLDEDQAAKYLALIRNAVEARARVQDAPTSGKKGA